MASDDYNKAQKLAKFAYRSAVGKGEYPYLPALDDIIDQKQVRTEESLGLVNIPLDQIVGTKTVGRQQAFARNWMPLMPEGSEFARKWDGVLNYHMDQGVGDPIIAYEYMNRFYVLEGNKRVSVLKFFHADSIEGTVTRLVPYPQETDENHLYYEFLDFYRKSRINYIWFTQLGSFAKLTKAVGKQQSEDWSDEDRMNFKSFYLRFTDLFRENGGDKLQITPGDALLFYLSLYPYKEVMSKTPAEMKSDVDKIWDEVPLIGSEKTDSAVSLNPVEEPGGNIFARFFKTTSSKKLNIAFIHDRPAEISSWSYSHELGRMRLEQVFGEKIHTEAMFFSGASDDISMILEAAIEAGNHIIFTTHQKFLAASLKAAIEHPEVKILNCSIGQPYSNIRTYYGRLYEAKFLAGMIAGAMTENDKIGYIAPYPILGQMANINAFALGARMINPRSKVFLHWTGQVDAEPLEDMIRRENIHVISDNDMIRPASEERLYGLYMVKGDSKKKLAAPLWNWGRFYERIIRDFLQGNWEKTEDVKTKPAINYWWGISSGIIDLIMASDLPHGTEMLMNIIKGQMYDDYFHPFWGEIPVQGGGTTGVPGQNQTPEEIINQNFLTEGVVGEIPPYESLNSEARVLLDMQNNITPEATTI